MDRKPTGPPPDFTPPPSGSGSTNYCAECEQHAREVVRLRRIIEAWEDERIWLAWDDSRGAKQIRTLTADKCRVLRHNTTAEAYAALEDDDE